MTKRLKSLGVRLRKVTSNKDFIRNTGKVLVAVAYVMFVVALAGEFAFAANNEESMFEGITTILQDLQTSILKWSTFGVIIGVGTGALMKKFSMGKQDKIELGNKLMKDSIIAFIILNATPKIINVVTNKLSLTGEIKSVITKGN